MAGDNDAGGITQRRREDVLVAILGVLAAAHDTIGTRRICGALLIEGIHISESTASRLLRETDTRGWSVPVGSKGRIVTEKGRLYLENLRPSRLVDARPHNSARVRDMRELLDLLQARRAAETAAARSAAEVGASRQQVERLERLVREHSDGIVRGELTTVIGLAFHRTIASITPNKFLREMTDRVLDPALDQVESLLDVALGTMHTESLAPEHHWDIVNAIRRRDPDAAEQAMARHLLLMVEEVEKYVSGSDGELFSRLLAWLDGRGREADYLRDRLMAPTTPVEYDVAALDQLPK